MTIFFLKLESFVTKNRKNASLEGGVGGWGQACDPPVSFLPVKHSLIKLARSGIGDDTAQFDSKSNTKKLL